MSDINTYVRGLMARANHHGHNVIDVLPAIVGYVYCTADPGSIKHFQRKGMTGTMTWAKFKGRLIAFKYNGKTKKIEAREGTTRGKVLGLADNKTKLSDLADFFQNL